MNLSDTTPAPPSGKVNVKWQKNKIGDYSAYVDPVPSGIVAGPSSAADSDFVQFDGTTGKLVKDGGLSLDTDGTLAADSDVKVPSQKAVKTYVDSAISGGGSTTGVMHSGAGSPNGIAIHDYTGAGATSVTLSGVQSGDVIVLFAQFEGDISGASASDSLGTTYTRVFNSTGLSLNVAILVGVASSTGSDTITWSPGGSFQRVIAVAIGGLSGTVDAVTGAANSASSAALSITTTDPGDLLLCFGAGFHGANTFTAGLSWRGLIQGDGSDANFVELKYCGAPGSYNCTWSLNGGADSSYIAAIALEPTTTTTPGNDGDFFIDGSLQGVYGPRSSGVYPLLGYLS